MTTAGVGSGDAAKTIDRDAESKALIIKLAGQSKFSSLT